MAKMKLPTPTKNAEDLTQLSDRQFDAVAKYKQQELQGKIDVALSALDLAKTFANVLDSYLQLENTKVDAKRRIQESKDRVEQAKLKLEESRVQAAASKDNNDKERLKIQEISDFASILKEELANIPQDNPRRQHILDSLLSLMQTLAHIG